MYFLDDPGATVDDEDQIFQIMARPEVVSAAIKTEVERILREKFSWPQERVTEATSNFWSLAHSIAMQQTVTDRSDPVDNRILKCASDSHAPAIVTGDGRLLSLHPYREIAILTPKRFLEVKPWRD